MFTKNARLFGLFALLLVAALLVGNWAATTYAAPPAAPAKGGGLAAPVAASSGDGGGRLLTLTGTGTATAAPDVVYVQLGVDVKSTSASEAVSESTASMTEVMAAIKALDVEDKDIQTVAYNIWVEEEYDKDGKPTGTRNYHVVNQLRITLRDLTMVGTLLEDALAAGANTVGGVQFGIEDPTALQKEARGAAMADATTRAQQLAEGLGVKLGEPYTITEYDTGGPVVVEKVMMQEGFGIGGGAVPVSAGELTIRVQVNVSWTIQ